MGTNQYRRGATAWKGRLRAAACLVLAACVAGYVWVTRGWPLVNDAALMHYVVFLMGRGMAPYRQIGEYNLPGSYAPEWLSMTLAGVLHISEAAMWRAFDVGAGLASAAAMVVMARPVSWFAGVWAGALYVLYHGRDGVGQAGQRDLWMTLLLLWGVALLLRAMRTARGRPWGVAGFGLCVGAAAMVKPQAALWLVCWLPLVWRARGERLRLASACLAGAAVPMAACWWWLARQHAVGAFWQTMWVDLPYHVSLSRGTVGQLLAVSSIASVAKLLVLGMAAWVAVRRGSRELWMAALCAALGLVSFVAQGKDYPYQRYPYVAFLLMALGLVFTQALRARGVAARALGAAGLAFGVLFCAPSYLRGAVQARWPVAVVQQMEAALRSAAAPRGMAALDGRVQCLDMVTGCTEALWNLQLRPATGVLYDELLFPERPNGWNGPEQAVTTGTLPQAVARVRAPFMQQMQASPPRVIVLSAWLFPAGPDDYAELNAWPWLRGWLAARYRLVWEQQFAPAENGPMGFRVYVLHGGLE